MRWRFRIVLWLLAVATLSGYFWLYRNALCDDAMLTLGYARGLAQRGAFEFLPGLRHYGFTSPLQVIVLSVVGRLAPLTLAPCLVAAMAMVLLLALAMRLLQRLGQPPWKGVCLVVLIAFNPLLLSTLGLETLLAVTIALAYFVCCFDKNWVGAGICAGLLVLTRPDLIVISLGVIPLRPGWRGLARLAVPCILVAALWHLFAWIYFGSMLPLTYFFKRGHSWGPYVYSNGLLLYKKRFLFATVASWSFAALGLLFFFTQQGSPPSRALTRAVTFGALAHVAAFTALRVPPHHWYYGPSLGLFLIAGWLCVKPWLSIVLAVGAAAAWLVLLGLSGFTFDEAPMHSNWATHRQYREIGLWLRQNLPPETAVEVAGEIGTIAYYSERELRDPFTHPARAMEWIRSLPQDRMMKWSFRFSPQPPPPSRTGLFLHGRTGDWRPRRFDQIRKEWSTQSRWTRIARWYLLDLGAAQQ